MEAGQINETWAMDFVHDQLATGRKIRVLTIVDIFSRFSPAVDPRFSYRGEDVVLTLERVCKTVGYPKTIRVDQGRSSSPAISTSGLTRRMSFSTSPGRASRPTTASSNPSTASSETNA
ncbi:transposase InsO family protein [Bradyrhizobium sp. GM22.5]